MIPFNFLCCYSNPARQGSETHRTEEMKVAVSAEMDDMTLEQDLYLGLLKSCAAVL